MRAPSQVYALQTRSSFLRDEHCAQRTMTLNSDHLFQQLATWQDILNYKKMPPSWNIFIGLK